MPFELRKPMWNGGKRVFGIAAYRLGSEGRFQLRCMYKNKHGDYSHPHLYGMDVTEIRTYPTMVVGNDVTLYLVPIDDWNIDERGD